MWLEIIDYNDVKDPRMIERIIWKLLHSYIRYELASLTMWTYLIVQQTRASSSVRCSKISESAVIQLALYDIKKSECKHKIENIEVRNAFSSNSKDDIKKRESNTSAPDGRWWWAHRLEILVNECEQSIYHNRIVMSNLNNKVSVLGSQWPHLPLRMNDHKWLTLPTNKDVVYIMCD